MGGLVGGAYATGMTPAELRELLRDVDWDLTFLREPPYQALVFRRKQDRRDLPVMIELGLKDGLSLPSGLDPAHQVGLLLSRISFPYTSDLRFDDLPTPFRAVATDLQASKGLVLEQGSLSQSLLATMAIPAVFPPVEIDGKLLAGQILGGESEFWIRFEVSAKASVERQRQSDGVLCGRAPSIATRAASVSPTIRDSI